MHIYVHKSKDTSKDEINWWKKCRQDKQITINYVWNENREFKTLYLIFWVKDLVVYNNIWNEIKWLKARNCSEFEMEIPPNRFRDNTLCCMLAVCFQLHNKYKEVQVSDSEEEAEEAGNPWSKWVVFWENWA